MDTTNRVADSLPDLLTTQEVADYLSVPVNTLYFWRRNGGGPRAVQLGKRLRYPKGDLLEYLGSLS